MPTNKHLVINNLAEKLKLFTHAVNGTLITAENFILSNTDIPTDTFNILLPKCAQLTNIALVRSSIENMLLHNYPFSTWIDANYLSASW